MPENAIFSYRTSEPERRLLKADRSPWKPCREISIDRYWNGRSALREKGHNWRNLTHVRSLWDGDRVFFQIRCWFDRLQVDPDWTSGSDRDSLCQKDVVELFLRPAGREDYFEVQISPLGQSWGCHFFESRGRADRQWRPQLSLAVEQTEREQIWTAVVGLPYRALAVAPPEVGGAWRINFCRIAGSNPEREHLAWRPTYTEKPDYHVPPAFGHLIFLDR